MKRAFMLIDYQNDFVNPETWALYVKDAEKIENTIYDLIKLFEEEKVLTIWTQDWHKFDTNYFAETLNVEPYTQLENGTIAWPRHCVENTFGAQYYWKIADFMPDLLVRKWQGLEKENYSAFDKDKNWVQILEKVDSTYKPLSWWNLVEILKQRWIDEIIMAGVATDYCVNEAVLAARKNGFNVKVVKNAIKAVFPDTEKEIFKKWAKEGVTII